MTVSVLRGRAIWAACIVFSVMAVATLRQHMLVAMYDPSHESIGIIKAISASAGLGLVVAFLIAGVVHAGGLAWTRFGGCAALAILLMSVALAATGSVPGGASTSLLGIVIGSALVSTISRTGDRLQWNEMRLNDFQVFSFVVLGIVGAIFGFSLFAQFGGYNWQPWTASGIAFAGMFAWGWKLEHDAVPEYIRK